jgi:hypothetical protein
MTGWIPALAGMTPALLTHSSLHFRNFARTNAGRADAHGLVHALHDGMNPAQVRVPPAPGDVVGVAYPVSVFGAFPADLTSQSHSITS